MKKYTPNMNNPVVPLQKKAEFTSTFFSNCNGLNCFSAVFCPCIVYGKNRAKLNEIETHNCSGDCWTFIGLFFNHIFFCFVLFNYSKIFSFEH